MLCALLAALLHLLLLALVGPGYDAGERRQISQPLVYSLPRVEIPKATEAARAPRPPTRPRASAQPAAHAQVTQQASNAPAGPPAIEPARAPVSEAGPAESPASPAETPQLASVPVPEPVPTLIPGSLRLKYDIQGEVRGLTYQADGELLWTHDGRDYEARLEIGAFLLGSRVQISRGRITPEGLEPLRFSDRTRRERSAELDHASGWARFSGGAPAAPLRAGAQDQLSIFVQLASLLASDPDRYPPGSELELQVVGLRDARIWRFVISEPQTLRLPVGEVITEKLTRQLTRADDELQVEVWFAPSFGWLPARIRLSQPNGDTLDQQWRGTAPL
jgi:hypothetical protein